MTLTLAQQMGAETGHHHEPLVAWVTSVRSAIDARPIDFVEEYGTAATTIRAFYAALADGQGAAASALVVPEKRSVPAFSPSGLTRFYSHLPQRIRLLGIAQSEPNIYVAHYRYATATHVCDGNAKVVTSNRAGRNYIQAIQPLNGC